MVAVGIFGNVFRHAVAPAGNDNRCWLVGWSWFGLLVTIAKVYSIRYRGEAREWNGFWNHCESMGCRVIPAQGDSFDLTLLQKCDKFEVFVGPVLLYASVLKKKKEERQENLLQWPVA